MKSRAFIASLKFLIYCSQQSGARRQSFASKVFSQTFFLSGIMVDAKRYVSLIWFYSNDRLRQSILKKAFSGKLVQLEHNKRNGM
ncbi:MAG: hypothetical protein B6D35_10710 [Candidatus Brocadia sp. UTAMX2]|nr:MAG: hypothetical protein B6D35_10710 [Candidatus Brocadia sp. UTAMX2]